MCKLISAVLLLFIAGSCFGQSCLPNGITFSTQQQIDDFATDYPGCTEIGASLYIQESTSGGITDLSGLSTLISIGGSLDIRDNDALTNLGGLDNLTSVGGPLNVFNNDAIVNLSGLDNLTSIGSFLGITDNDAIANLSGLDGLTSIGDFLFIALNNALSDISAIQNIDPSSISSGGGDNIIMYDNPLLAICEVQFICDALALPGTTTDINNNAPGCNSQAEVETACAAILPVTYSQVLKALKHGSYVELSFITAQEINNSHFAIEHSSDGRSFQTIGKIAGQGTTATETAYEYTHEHPATGINYYRVKQVDYDGQYSYSNVASVVYTVEQITVFPNPASVRLIVSTPSELSYVVRQVNGRAVMTGHTGSVAELDI